MVSVLPQVAKLGGMALDLLFPKWCLGCDKEGTFICSSCSSTMPRVMPPLCPRCGRPQASNILCSRCVRWAAEIDGIRAPYRFEGVVRQSVYKLKYENLRAITEHLAQMLYSYISENQVPGDVLVPVPLHSKRLRERGYNQATLLAMELSKLTGLPLLTDHLIRERDTHPQALTKTASERQGNVTNAFYSRELRYREVLLIDDVATSGATLNACAAALKAAGATSVWGLVLAR
ncbi:MAG: ComF family protein [Dehalococcoidales bacterium]|nr:MAG: ComF family protein [Dehalococcoidales bacterium]